MRTLVIGGTRFFGKHLVYQLLGAGHDVTIITRGQTAQPFGDDVQHIVVDRTDDVALRRVIEQGRFELIYDNICYDAKQAKALCDIVNDYPAHVVLTSTMAVYEADGICHTETDFDSTHYDYDLTAQPPYGEAKRQAEAVFKAHAKFPVAIARFPIVMGEDDYTERLQFYVTHIQQQQPFAMAHLEAEMSFILAEEAASFLQWLATQTGAWNATANGTISMGALLQLIESVTGERAIVTTEGDSPYNIPKSWYMSNDKATAAGFSFSSLDDWLRPLIAHLATY